jgi:large subunit ribosomal protein L25
MKSLKLSAYPRTQTRRKGSKALRAAGRIPANIYGKTAAAQNIEVDSIEFGDLVHAAHTEIILVDLKVQGDAREERLALVQDVQHHPLSGKVLHVDFHEVKPDERVTIKVPVESAGEPVGVKSGGGTLEHVLIKVKVRALPRDLPDQILVDVSALDIGKSIHLGDIVPPAGVEILGDKHITVLAVAAPVTEAEAAPAADAAAAGDAKQPEMIKEKKDDAAPAAAGKADDKKAAEKKK